MLQEGVRGAGFAKSVAGSADTDYYYAGRQWLFRRRSGWQYKIHASHERVPAAFREAGRQVHQVQAPNHAGWGHNGLEIFQWPPCPK